MSSEQCATGDLAADVLPVDPDLDLVLKVQAGDLAAFEPLYARYEQPLYRYFLRSVGNRTESEDLVSTTLLAAMEAIPRFRGRDESDGHTVPFRAFLGGIARRVLMANRRKHSTWREVSVETIVAGAPERSDAIDRVYGAFAGADPVEQLIAMERCDGVCRAVARLRSDAQFTAAILHYLAEFSHQEIAVLLDVRCEVVNTRLQDTRKAMGRLLTGPA